MKVSIEKELLFFIRKLIQEHNITRIIAVERKGTAVLRALIEMQNSEKLNWSWRDIVSSDALDRVQDELLLGHKILIFDDMLHTGFHLWEEVIPFLENKPIWNDIKNNIITAAFAVHEKCPKERLPEHWFYNELDTESYEDLRERIIEMLQRHGSLLLDTEHIEVRAKIKCDLRQFFEIFSVRGSIADFRSSDNRLNLTVAIPDDACDLSSYDFIPPDTSMDQIVKKCRIIQRTKNEFAIIPICYPSVPINFADNFKFGSALEEIFGKELCYEKGRFYSVALLASLIILEEILTAVLTLGPDKVELDLPKIDSNRLSDMGYNLEHLLAMYPNVDIRKLTEYILNIVNNARIKSTPLRGKKSKKLGGLLQLEESKINENARILAQLVRKIIADKKILSDASNYKSYMGMTAKELIELGKKHLKLKFIDVSVALDRLIDEAYFVTHVAEIKYKDDIIRLTRTFEPDGEIVSARIKRYTELYGLPEVVLG